jgi:hypothetical protein
VVVAEQGADLEVLDDRAIQQRERLGRVVDGQAALGGQLRQVGLHDRGGAVAALRQRHARQLGGA